MSGTSKQREGFEQLQVNVFWELKPTWCIQFQQHGVLAFNCIKSLGQGVVGLLH